MLLCTVIVLIVFLQEMHFGRNYFGQHHKSRTEADGTAVREEDGPHVCRSPSAADRRVSAESSIHRVCFGLNFQH